MRKIFLVVSLFCLYSSITFAWEIVEIICERDESSKTVALPGPSLTNQINKRVFELDASIKSLTIAHVDGKLCASVILHGTQVTKYTDGVATIYKDGKHVPFPGIGRD